MQDYDSESVYYNRDTNSYCYVGTNEPNHDSVIIGWDDDYQKKISIWIWRVTGIYLYQQLGRKLWR